MKLNGVIDVARVHYSTLASFRDFTRRSRGRAMQFCIPPVRSTNAHAHAIQGVPCLPYKVRKCAGLLCDIEAHVSLCMHRAVSTVAVILALVLFVRAAHTVLPKACLLCA